MKKQFVSAFCILACAAVIGGIAGKSFYDKRHFVEDIVPGEHVTETFMLSEYNPNLKGTMGDTEVYVLRGEKEGGQLLVLGSTHANEPAGHMTAIVLEENAKVNEGTIYVIPSISKSGLSHNDPLEGSPQYMHFTTPSGEQRVFQYGSRAANVRFRNQKPEPLLPGYCGRNPVRAGGLRGYQYDQYPGHRYGN